MISRLPAVVEGFFVESGASVVARMPLEHEVWNQDRSLFGIAISPPISRIDRDLETSDVDRRWIAIADTEIAPNSELARHVARELDTPVVISMIFEIVDPVEAETIVVFGATPGPQFQCLYELIGFRYQDLAHPLVRFHPAPPFDPQGVAFLTFRGARPRTHYDACSDDMGSDEDIAF